MAVADYASRTRAGAPLTMHAVLEAMIKAHEIQGVLALKTASPAWAWIMSCWSRSPPLRSPPIVGRRPRADRGCAVAGLGRWPGAAHLPAHTNTGARKSWAAGDATSRGVRLALLTLNGESGYPGALSASTWGFYDVAFKGKRFTFARTYGSYVMENVLFKITFPAEFHAQTAVEAALQLHPQVKHRVDDIERVTVAT